MKSSDAIVDEVRAAREAHLDLSFWQTTARMAADEG